MIMNGQIKQRRGGVWLFTSMGNFSHHGQTVEMGAKNVSQRYGKFHQLFIKKTKKKKQPLSFFNSNYCILELIITGNNEKSKTASEKKLEISLSVS